jgi:hypothetical protein
MVVHARSDDTKRVVHVGELQKRFALYICIGDIDSIKRGRVVVEDAEQVVVVSEDVVVGVGLRSRCCWHV